jgi:FkbM family methyltransferase
MIISYPKIFKYQQTLKDKLTFVQIGTNNGNDYFNRLCKEYKPENIILIEPHSHLNEQIIKNYEGLNFTIINKAVTDNDNIEEIQMFGCSKPQHSSIMPLKDWNKEEHTKNVPATTIYKILHNNNIQRVDLLYIDTEGFDSFIINYIINNNLLELFDCIVFEHWGFKPEDYDTPLPLHGLKGMEHIRSVAEKFNFIYADFITDGDHPNDNHVIYKKI